MKRFGPVQALRGADFSLRPGEVHALLGENGAGKTTLMHVAYGLAQPDAGEVRVRGARADVRSPRDARRLGLGMVHQHFTSIPALTVAENVALEAGWRIRPAELNARVAELATRLGMPLDPRRSAESLPVALLQRLEIVKALASDTDVLLLDEPTALLAPAEADELLAVVRRFAASGGAAVLITHKLREALAVADRVTVLRQGVVVLESATRTQSAAGLAAAMIGGAGRKRAGEQDAPGGAADRPHVPARLDSAGEVLVRAGHLEVRAGEIVGIAAVEGNGQRELLRAIAGVERQRDLVLEVAEPVAFIAEDRTNEGLIPQLSLTENYVLGTLGRLPFTTGVKIGWREARRRTADLIGRTTVNAQSEEAVAATLSGGNQQKFVIGRAMDLDPRVIVAENPTRGLDPGAMTAVHAELRAAAAAGSAIVVHSTDLDEVIALASRIIVMSGGRIVAVRPGSDRETIGRLMLGAGE